MKNIIKSILDRFKVKKSVCLEKNGKSIASDFGELERKIGYKFKDMSLLGMALTHTSCYYNQDRQGQPVSEYERMEFLGDSVLGLVTAEFLYFKFENKNEGYLSKLKSQIVSENFLSVKAKGIDLGKYIILGEEEFRDKGYHKKSILSNMMESLICAIYFDGGYDAANSFITKHILSGYKEELTSDVHINYKSKLQEHCQSKYKQLPVYKLMSTNGPDHKKQFTIDVSLQGKMIGTGLGYTKKDAEQDAAKRGCQTLGL